MYIRTGTYDGDGNVVGRSFSGLGFQPDVMVWTIARINTTQTAPVPGMVWRIAGMYNEGGAPLRHQYNMLAGGTNPNGFVSFDADGFTVQFRTDTESANHDNLNDPNGRYTWMAIGITDVAREKIITYTGNGAASRALTGVGFAPEMVMVVSSPTPTQTEEQAKPPATPLAVKFGASADLAGVYTTTSYLYGAGWGTTGITTLDADGFTVNAGVAPKLLNDTGIPYVALCLRYTVGTFKRLNYSGNSAVARAVVGAGFAPAVAWLFGFAAPTSGVDMMRLTPHPAGPSPSSKGPLALSGLIDSLDADGLTVTHSATLQSANLTGYYYHALCWAEVPAPTTITGPLVPVAAGTDQLVTWRAITTPEPGDWVGLYLIGTTYIQHTTFFLTGRHASSTRYMTIPKDTPAGTYELRLYQWNGTTGVLRATSAAFAITATPASGPSSRTTLVLPADIRLGSPDARLWLLDDEDRIVTELADCSEWSYERKLNQVGTLNFTLSRGSPNLPDALRKGASVIVRLRYQDTVSGDSYVSDDWEGFIQHIALSQPQESRFADRYNFVAYNLLDLLRWRIVIPPPGEEALDLDSDFGDVAIKNAVRGSLTESGDARRNWTGLSTEPNRNHGKAVKYSARYSRLYDVVTTLAGQSDLSFDIVRTTDPPNGAWEFRTYYPLQGVDRTPDNVDGNIPVILAVELSSLAGAEWALDYTNLRSAVYVGGSGTGTDRAVDIFVDTTSLSNYDWRETFLDERNATSAAKRVAAATSFLNSNAYPEEQIQVTLPALAAYQYRRDWDLGDQVLVRITGLPDASDQDLLLELDATITGVRVTVRGDSLVPRIEPTVGMLRRTLIDTIREQQRSLSIVQTT